MLKRFYCRKCQAENWAVCWSFSDIIVFAVAISILVTSLALAFRCH